MARCELQGFDDFTKAMNKLGSEVGNITKKALDRASPELDEALRQCIRSEANKGYATGELEHSIIRTKSKQNAYGYFVAVMPTGTDKKGLRNGEKMAYLEYGTSRQEAHPVMQKAIRKAEPKCLKTIDEVFEAYIDKLWQ